MGDGGAGCPAGLAPLVPRSRAHWASFVGFVQDVLEGQSADAYFGVIPGVYSDGGGCGGCCGGVLNSDACASARATDGGDWWIGDAAQSEPNGDWTSGCFLNAWGIPAASAIAAGAAVATYNDNSCPSSTHERPSPSVPRRVAVTSTVAWKTPPTPEAQPLPSHHLVASHRIAPRRTR